MDLHHSLILFIARCSFTPWVHRHLRQAHYSVTSANILGYQFIGLLSFPIYGQEYNQSVRYAKQRFAP